MSYINAKHLVRLYDEIMSMSHYCHGKNYYFSMILRCTYFVDSTSYNYKTRLNNS